MSESPADVEPHARVVIGASAGGVEKLVRVRRGLSADLRATPGRTISDSDAVAAERRRVS